MAFRRALLADPRRLDDGAGAHVEQCATCRAFYDRTLEQEEELEATLRVPVPEDLEARVFMRTAVLRRRRWRWLALAASVVGAAVFTLA